MAKTVDQELIRKAWALKRKGMEQEAIANEIGIGLRQTQRYLDINWLAERGLENLQHVPATQQFQDFRFPTVDVRDLDQVRLAVSKIGSFMGHYHPEVQGTAGGIIPER